MTTPLLALANILVNGILTLESAYAKNGMTYPSLDDPFSPDSLDGDEVLENTTRVIIGAAAQIIATVRLPVETLQESSLAMYTPVSLGLAADLGVADILKAAGPAVCNILFLLVLWDSNLRSCI